MRPDSTTVKAKPSFDFNAYMKDRAQLIDAALDKSVPVQYPEVINEAMRYSLLAGAHTHAALCTRSIFCWLARDAALAACCHMLAASGVCCTLGR